MVNAFLWRMSDVFALLGGVILFAIVLVTTTNAGAFILDRVAGTFGAHVSALPGYEDFVRLAISGAALMFFPYCQAKRGHVAVDLITDRLPRVIHHTLNVAWLLLTSFLAGFLIYWMVFGMLQSRGDSVVVAVLGWAVWPFYLPGILGVTLWGAVALAQATGQMQDA